MPDTTDSEAETHFCYYANRLVQLIIINCFENLVKDLDAAPIMPQRCIKNYHIENFQNGH